MSQEDVALLHDNLDCIIDAFCFVRDLRDAGEGMRYILGEDYDYFESFFTCMTPQLVASLPVRPPQLDSPSRHFFALQLLRLIADERAEKLAEQQQHPSPQQPAVQSSEPQLAPTQPVVSSAVQSVEQQPVEQPAVQELTTSTASEQQQDSRQQAAQQLASASPERSLARKPAPSSQQASRHHFVARSPRRLLCRIVANEQQRHRHHHHHVARPLEPIMACFVANKQQSRQHRHHHPPWSRLDSSTVDCSADWRAAHGPAPDPVRDKPSSLIVVSSR